MVEIDLMVEIVFMPLYKLDLPEVSAQRNARIKTMKKSMTKP